MRNDFDNYGKELILDIHNCNSQVFTRKSIKKFLHKLCVLIDMNPEDLHFWDYEDEPEEYKKAPIHLRGISVVQFITTSSIVLHSLTDMKRLYINIFSCKDFNSNDAKEFILIWCDGDIKNVKEISRI